MLRAFVVSLCWRNLWRNPRRTIITLLVVSAGLWSILTFAVVQRAWSESAKNSTIQLITGEGQIHPVGYLDDPTVASRMGPPNAILSGVLQSPAVKAYAVRVRVTAVIESEYRALPVSLMGVVPEQEQNLSVIPRQIAQGRYLTGTQDEGIVLGRLVAKRLNTRLGKRVVIMTQTGSGHLAERAFPVVGLFAAPDKAEGEFVFTGLSTAQALTGIGGDISEIAFDAAEPGILGSLIAELRRAAPDADVQSWMTLAPVAYEVSNFSNQFVMLWLWIMVAMMAIGIVNTQLMAVFDRTREFALMQALGMRPRLIVVLVACESAILIGIAALMGVALSAATTHAFSRGVDLQFLRRGAELVDAGRILYPRVSERDFVVYGLLIWTVGLLAALWPATRAAKVSPVDAMTRAPL